jgi:phage baseplate assembly protein gpV
MENKHIEIKSVDAVEVAIPNKVTVYCCIYWNHGMMFSNGASVDKQYIESYAYGMRKHGQDCQIYKFEIDAPLMNKNK